MREKNQMLNFRVSPAELERINKKREELGVRNMGAYLRKMALDGVCVKLDLEGVTQITRLLSRCSNNLNQYAKRANETGNIYLEDIRDLQKSLDEIWEQQRKLLAKLAALK